MASFMSSPSTIDTVVARSSGSCGAAGGAMWDPPSHTPTLFPTGLHCWLMNAPPVIIDDRYMSVNDGFKHINFVFKTCGNQPCCPNNYALPQGGIG